MTILGIIVLGVFIFVSYKQKKLVNGLLICTASILIFNVTLPIIHQIYHPEIKLNYIYILIYYGVYYLAIASGYYLFYKENRIKNYLISKINLLNDAPKQNYSIFKNIIIGIIFLICLVIIFSVPIEYLKNPRILYENTRLGFGHIYFLLSMLLNIYFIFAMFTEKKYYYMIIVFILLYFTGSKSRMLLPIEMFFLYYFYVRNDDRSNIKKILLWGAGIIVIFIGVFSITSYYLPEKNLTTIINTLANYSDYNRNFIQLIDKLAETKQYFHGIISVENNFVSLIPRVIWENKPTIFGSFRLSYMIYPEWTLLFQGAPSFGTFGSLFADFGHISLVVIAIYNFIIGGLIAVSEEIFVNKKNPITFMIFIIFMGILLVDIGISATSILVINLIFVFIMYFSLIFIGKVIKKYINNTKN